MAFVPVAPEFQFQQAPPDSVRARPATHKRRSRHHTSRPASGPWSASPTPRRLPIDSYPTPDTVKSAIHVIPTLSCALQPILPSFTTTTPSDKFPRFSVAQCLHKNNQSEYMTVSDQYIFTYFYLYKHNIHIDFVYILILYKLYKLRYSRSIKSDFKKIISKQFPFIAALCRRYRALRRHAMRA